MTRPPPPRTSRALARAPAMHGWVPLPVLAFAALEQVVEAFRAVDLIPLPRGAAPVVMIFGGITVMSAALLLAMLEPRPAPGGRGRGPAPQLPRLAPMQGPRYAEGFALGKGLAPLHWAQALVDAGDLGLGEARQGPTEPGRLRMRLAGCRTCRLHAKAPEEGCTFERGFLQGAAEHFAPRWHVTEVRCGRGIDNLCEFDVRGPA